MTDQLKPLDELKASIEAAVATAIGGMSESDRLKLEEIIERSAVHTSMANTAALKVEANTLALLLWTESNERGKRARQDIIDAIAAALVRGLIAAL